MEDGTYQRKKDAEGKFLGSGFTDLKENKLEYKNNSKKNMFEIHKL